MNWLDKLYNQIRNKPTQEVDDTTKAMRQQRKAEFYEALPNVPEEHREKLEKLFNDTVMRESGVNCRCTGEMLPLVKITGYELGIKHPKDPNPFYYAIERQ